MLLDLDNFKELNDTYGHALGDQLLVEVAYRLKECVNLGDTVVRLGYYITGSIGVAVFQGSGIPRETLLSRADSAMYKAKQLGKNTAVITNIQNDAELTVLFD